MRVVIGEDEALLRQGLVLLLEGTGVTVAGVASTGPELVELAATEAPDLVITDIRMPPHHTDDGLRAAIAIRAARPATPVLVLSQHVQRRYALELLGDQPRGVGYLLKQRIADVTSFVRDVHLVADGGVVLDPEVVASMLTRAHRDATALECLTPRQREVLALLAEGRSNASIARQLTISDKAVVQHVSRIYDQLGLPLNDNDHRRVLAVVRYLIR